VMVFCEYGNEISGSIKKNFLSMCGNISSSRTLLRCRSVGRSVLNLGSRWRRVVSFTFRPFYPRYPLDRKSRDSSVGIALGYGLDDWDSRIRFPAGAGNVSLHHLVQNGSGAHPASYPLDNRGSFCGGKAAGV
jgi:hypothetical protein